VKFKLFSQIFNHAPFVNTPLHVDLELPLRFRNGCLFVFYYFSFLTENWIRLFVALGKSTT
jgi:hypothetical protein